MSVRDLPALNAGLNATSAILLLAGFLFIRARRRRAHARCMATAATTSALFLISYVVYHAQVGSVPYRGPMRFAYLSMLTSHVVLAAAIVPLVLVTLTRALRGQFDLHRRIARLTLPLWAYVSVTGVLIYVLLYRL